MCHKLQLQLSQQLKAAVVACLMWEAVAAAIVPQQPQILCSRTKLQHSQMVAVLLQQQMLATAAVAVVQVQVQLCLQ
jgi:hypothetical protein